MKCWLGSKFEGSNKEFRDARTKMLIRQIVYKEWFHDFPLNIKMFPRTSVENGEPEKENFM